MTSVSARKFVDPDGTSNDTAALTAAFDFARTVVLETGKTYRTDGLYLPTGATLDLNGATIQHLNGETSNNPAVGTKLLGSTGSMTAGSATLTLASLPSFDVPVGSHVVVAQAVATGTNATDLISHVLSVSGTTIVLADPAVRTTGTVAVTCGAMDVTVKDGVVDGGATPGASGGTNSQALSYRQARSCHAHDLIIRNSESAGFGLNSSLDCVGERIEFLNTGSASTGFAALIFQGAKRNKLRDFTVIGPNHYAAVVIDDRSTGDNALNHECLDNEVTGGMADFKTRTDPCFGAVIGGSSFNLVEMTVRNATEGAQVFVSAQDSSVPSANNVIRSVFDTCDIGVRTGFSSGLGATGTVIDSVFVNCTTNVFDTFGNGTVTK